MSSNETRSQQSRQEEEGRSSEARKKQFFRGKRSCAGGSDGDEKEREQKEWKEMMMLDMRIAAPQHWIMFFYFQPAYWICLLSSSFRDRVCDNKSLTYLLQWLVIHSS